MRNTARWILFFVLMLVVAFPFLQHCFSIYESGKLNGAVTLAADTKISLRGWFDGSYQKQKNDYLNDNAGCRSDLVRLNNQVDFWVFNKLHANGVVAGKDDFLYEKMYIDEYNGIDFMGDSLVRAMVYKLKKVQDTLDQLGKTFVFMYAPSKAWYFPDKFPGSLDMKRSGDTTNYATFRRLGDSVGLRQVDFNGWFMGMKDTSRHVLFSRVGTHWTVYGSLLASDSIIKYMERERKLQLSHLQWNTIERTEKSMRTDADLAEGLNLAINFKKEQFSYPQYDYIKKDSARPKAIYIGDSFLWTLIENKLMHNINSDWQVWYYFNVAWNEKALSGQEPSREIVKYNWQNDLRDVDFIITLFTPANFKGFNYNASFVEQLYNHYYPDLPNRARVIL